MPNRSGLFRACMRAASGELLPAVLYSAPVLHDYEELVQVARTISSKVYIMTPPSIARPFERQDAQEKCSLARHVTSCYQPAKCRDSGSNHRNVCGHGVNPYIHNLITTELVRRVAQEPVSLIDVFDALGGLDARPSPEALEKGGELCNTLPWNDSQWCRYYSHPCFNGSSASLNRGAPAYCHKMAGTFKPCGSPKECNGRPNGTSVHAYTFFEDGVHVNQLAHARIAQQLGKRLHQRGAGIRGIRNRFGITTWENVE